jgi:hypothetical protein
MQIVKWQHAYTFFLKSFNSIKEQYFYFNINRNFVTSTSELNPFQPSDAMWRHTFHLSLICMSFAQLFQQSPLHNALTFLRTAVYDNVTQHMNKGAFIHTLGDFSIYSRA